MPTLPLLNQTAAPDGWHDVRAPGGYEWWYFDAEDAATDTQVVAIFLDGFVFHPGYLRRHFAYLRRPTKVPPAVARDFPCAYFVVYRGGRVLHQFMTQYAPNEFQASADGPAVRIGPNTLTRDGPLRLGMSGSPWHLTWQGPKTARDRTLTADLSFDPLLPHAPDERPFFSRELAGADHHWVLANPLCDVAGTIRCGGEAIAFSGRGYHDHNYGTGPIGPGLKRWVWGRVLFENRAVTFHHATPRDGSLADETHVIEATAAAARGFATNSTIDWSARSLASMNLAYPRSLDFGEMLRLTNPRVVDAAPFYLRLTYDAASRGERGRAFCEVAHPHRLRWPVLGRMIEMSIDKSPLVAGSGSPG